VVCKSRLKRADFASGRKIKLCRNVCTQVGCLECCKVIRCQGFYQKVVRQSSLISKTEYRFSHQNLLLRRKSGNGNGDAMETSAFSNTIETLCPAFARYRLTLCRSSIYQTGFGKQSDVYDTLLSGFPAPDYNNISRFRIRELGKVTPDIARVEYSSFKTDLRRGCAG
jgi:hypothetical protein